ncbi:MAG: glycosyltransferase family 2 protein [Parcubacteria group bacterium]|nr:glycosyltransferase family 2 protein [Parcubacteria group bacterium]
MAEYDPYLSVIIPAYNEAERLPRTLRAVDEYLVRQPFTYEIIVVNDGAHDNTAEVVRSLKASIRNLKLIDNTENHGKGWVVKQGLLAALGEIRLFMDADNSTSVDHVERMLPLFQQGCDVVIGSRRVKGAKIAVHQSFLREQIGRVFNLIVRIIAGLPYIDTQAGFKAFTVAATEAIFPRQILSRWAFDVEVLVIARRLGFKICEVPITWVNDPKTTVKLRGMIMMFFEVLAVRWNLLRGIYHKAQS